MIIHGDCLEQMATLPAESVDSIVTDPPYGLSFMGKDWDYGVPGEAFWREALRVAKPGAHLLAFGGSRTYHRLACAIEDAGWEVRDCIMWVYGSGFPKSHDVSKAIDREAGAEREVVDVHPYANRGTAQSKQGVNLSGSPVREQFITAPATDAAKQWQGWGTALKPAVEVIMLARKPLNADTERDIIIENLTRMEAQLWLLLHAKTAGQDSTLNQLDLGEAFATAQWNAGGLTSTLADLCGQTDMSRFESALTTSLNTVSSWLSILEECWRLGSTFTTEMKTRPIIDLKTLRCLLSETTLEGIIKVELQAPGSALSALPVSVYLNAVKKNMEGIQTLFAIENAISQASKTGLRPDFEPIIVARKPLVGTVAANVQQYGTGAINIDGCRVNPGQVVPGGGRSKRGVNGGGIYNDGEAMLNANPHTSGRWPANFIHDGSDEVVGLFPVTTSGRDDKHGRKKSTFCASTDWEALREQVVVATPALPHGSSTPPKPASATEMRG